MQERIEQELALLRRYYPGLVYVPTGLWIWIAAYPLSAGWNREATAVAFQISPGHPGTPPYGIYAPVGLRFNAVRPNNYTEPAGTQPPFQGSWGVFSWLPSEGEWQPAVTLTAGTNLLTWVRGFAERFKEGL